MATNDIEALRRRVTELERQLGEYQRTDTALRESRELFQAFMSNSPVAAYLKDEEGRYIYANRTVDQLLGPGFGQWWGKSDQQLWPEDVALRVRESDRQALASGGTIRVEESLPAYGGERHFLSFKFPFTASTNRQYLAGVALDITDHARLEQERKQSLEREHQARRDAEAALSILRQTENRLRCLFDSHVIGILEINHETILDANDSFLRMLGYERHHLHQGGLRWREICPPRYLALMDLAIERLLQKGSFVPFEKELICRDGKLVPVWIGGVLLNPAPEWTSVAFVLDLTERKALESQFRSAQKMETLGLMASGITHDFNNLLTAIMANATLAIETLTPDHPAYRHLEEVLHGSRMAGDLTQQLLSFSGKRGSAATTVDLSATVRSTSSLIELLMPRKIDLRLNLRAGIPPVSADQTQINQVLMNLVINAADAIGNAPGTITVTTGSRDLNPEDLKLMTLGGDLPGGQYACFQVTDTGCGISPDTMSRMFDPMFTTKARGWGFGLSVVQGIVRSHHGALQVESEVGKGTVFSVYLPASAVSSVQEQARTNGDLSGTGVVLLVDDEAAVLRVAEVTLARYGYRVLSAESGEEAIQLFKKSPASIDLVVVDLAMPSMDGEEIIKQLQEIRPDTRIVVSSGYSEMESMERLGGFPFLPKPYTSRELAERVKAVVGR